MGRSCRRAAVLISQSVMAPDQAREQADIESQSMAVPLVDVAPS